MDSWLGRRIVRFIRVLCYRNILSRDSITMELTPSTNARTVVYSNFERTDELNSRIFDRVDGVDSNDNRANDGDTFNRSNNNHPTLEPSFDIRGTSTKYTHLQIHDQRKRTTVPRKQYKSYAQDRNETPGQNGAPFSGFSQAVDTETVLRNQVVPLNRGEENTFVPSTGSDLYFTSQASESNRMTTVESQPFSDMFDMQAFPKHNPNTLDVGGDMFSNHTREQRGAV